MLNSMVKCRKVKVVKNKTIYAAPTIPAIFSLLMASAMG
jgi:hypothetical protein